MATLKQAATTILVIDPGSTSTKIGVFRNGWLIVDSSIKHDRDAIDRLGSIADQEEMRFAAITDLLREKSLLHAVLKPLPAAAG